MGQKCQTGRQTSPLHFHYTHALCCNLNPLPWKVVTCPSLPIWKPVPVFLVGPDDRVTRSLSGFRSESRVSANRDKDKKREKEYYQVLAGKSSQWELNVLLIPQYPLCSANGKMIWCFSAVKKYIYTFFFLKERSFFITNPRKTKGVLAGFAEVTTALLHCYPSVEPGYNIIRTFWSFTEAHGEGGGASRYHKNETRQGAVEYHKM